MVMQREIPCMLKRLIVHVVGRERAGRAAQANGLCCGTPQWLRDAAVRVRHDYGNVRWRTKRTHGELEEAKSNNCSQSATASHMQKEDWQLAEVRAAAQ